MCSSVRNERDIRNNGCYSRIVRCASIPNNGHITLCMLAHAFLTRICAQDLISTMVLEVAPDGHPLLPLTVPEVRHLLGHLIWPPSSSVKLVLAWSWWRRCHRSGASYFHTRRRLKAG